MKSHFKNEHKISTSQKANMPFKCSECRSLYWYFPDFKKHVVAYHSREPYENTKVTMPVNLHNEKEVFVMDGVETGPTISNPYFFEDSVSICKMHSLVVDLIIELRCDLALPETKLQVFIKSLSSLLSWSQRYSMSVIKTFITTKQLSLDDVDILKLLNNLFIPDITANILTHQDNIAFIGSRAKCLIPEPVEIVLGKRKITHRVLLHPSRGKKFQSRIKRNQFSQKVKVKKDVFHYISLIDTLRLIMSNPEAREMIETEAPRKDETIRTFKDGRQFSLNTFLNKYPCALRLSLHIDEGEYANPLGSRKGNNKLTNICIKLQNIDARLNSSLERVYVVLMVKSSVLKKYGYKKVLQPLIDDILKLESEEGIQIKIDEGQ